MTDAIMLPEGRYIRGLLANHRESHNELNPIWRLSDAILANIHALVGSSWREVWQPDMAAKAVDERNLDHADSKQADQKLWAELEVAKQRFSKPYMFLHHTMQLTAAAPHLWRIQDCELYFVPRSVFQSGASKEAFMQFAARLVYEQVRQWLLALPLCLEEEVYVATRPQETLITTWQTFCTHWPVFNKDGTAWINIVDDTSNWYLFFHPEDIIIFGCKKDYASRHAMPTASFLSSGEELSAIFKKTLYSTRDVKQELLGNKFLALQSI